MKTDTTEMTASERIDVIAKEMLDELRRVGEDAPSRVGRAMGFNWNRMSVLSKKERTSAEEKEYSDRIGFQNAFSGATDDARATRIAAMIEPINNLDTVW